MKFPKKQAQRLIPEYLLDYTTKLNESHPDPTESWGGGSSVIANPTLSGDEATLDGLEVDGTKYKVGGGSEVHLYAHYIHMRMDITININLVIYKNDNIQFTYASIISWLYSNGFSGADNNFYNANGYYANGNGIVLGIVPGSRGYFKLFYEYIKDNSLKFMSGEALADEFIITDHITQIF